MDAEEIISMLEKSKGNSSYTQNPYNIPFTISPNDFISYAKEDFGLGEDTHHLVNTLSNVKRAIECKMDCIIASMGYLDQLKQENWNIPIKINFIEKLGILAPRILHKIGTKRNLLEHEYQKPTKEEVEDALDVGVLFLGYAEHLDRWLPSSYKLNSTNDEYIKIDTTYEKGKKADFGKFVVNKKDKTSTNEKKIFETKAGEDDYYKLLSYLLKRTGPLPPL